MTSAEDGLKLTIGSLVFEIAALKAENERLKAERDALAQSNRDLLSRITTLSARDEDAAECGYGQETL